MEGGTVVVVTAAVDVVAGTVVVVEVVAVASRVGDGSTIVVIASVGSGWGGSVLSLEQAASATMAAISSAVRVIATRSACRIREDRSVGFIAPSQWVMSLEKGKRGVAVDALISRLLIWRPTEGVDR